MTSQPPRTAYRESAPPAQCARCGTQHAATGHALCTSCARRETRRDRRVLGIVVLGAVTAVAAVAIVRLEPRAFPRTASASAGPRDEGSTAPSDDSSPATPTSADPLAPGAASSGTIEHTLAVLDRSDGEDDDGAPVAPARPDGAARRRPQLPAVLVVRARPCAGEPSATPCRELALVRIDGVARWQAPLSARARVAAVDGVVLVAELLHATARSALTGGSVWEHELGLVDEPIAAGAAEHTFVVTDGARVRGYAAADGAPRFDLAIGPQRAAVQPSPAARARLRFSLEPHRPGLLLAVDLEGPGQAAAYLVAGNSLVPDEVHAVWIGAGGLRLRAQSEPDELAHAAATNAGSPRAREALSVLHIARDELAAGTRDASSGSNGAVAELGTGRWEPPGVDGASAGAPIAFREDGAGAVYALASRGTEAVLVALRAPALAVQWSRRISLEPEPGSAEAPREPAPVDFAASPGAVVLALDAGHRLAWLDPRSGAMLHAAPGVQVR